MRARLFAPTEIGPVQNGDEPSRQWPEPVHDDAFLGLAGAIVNTIKPHTEADPAALLVQLLAGFGNLVGRRAYFLVEATKHFPNLFVTIAGKTSKARKGTSWGHILSVLSRVEAQWANQRIKGGLSSGEGLIEAVRDSEGKDKRLLVVESEFASVLHVMQRSGNTIAEIIRQAWDTGDINVLTKIPVSATGAHVSMIGHITCEELRRLLADSEITNGFANRYLYACAARSQSLPEGGHIEDVADTLTKLADELREALDWLKGHEQPLEIRRDTAARQLWCTEYERLSEGKPGKFGLVTSRAEAQVTRIALIYAVLDGSEFIAEDHLRAALAVWDYCERSARFIFGEQSGDPTADAILAELRKNPDGLTRTEISQLFCRNRSSSQLHSALNTLAEQGRAKQTHQNGEGKRGRPYQHWVAIQ